MNTTSKRLVPFAMSVTLLLALPGTPGAQRLTEIYIPIGQSPGLGAGNSVRGAVERVNAGRRTVTVAGETIRVAPGTPVWIDRTHLGSVNSTADLSAIRPGATVEIMFEDPPRRGAARWIKVRAGG